MTIIRKASQKDAKALLDLIRELAAYEGLIQYLKTDLDQITESGFSNGQPPKFEVIVENNETKYLVEYKNEKMKTIKINNE